MGTIAEKLYYLWGTRQQIKEAIESKGVTVHPTTPFREYAELILRIYGNRTDHELPSTEPGDGTVVGKLKYLEDTKDLIRQALELQGVTVPADATFRDYANLVYNIADTGGEEPDEPDDGLVDYNGVMLPDVSPYITDKYPDAAILKIGNIYNLVVLGGKWQIVGDVGYLSTCVCATSITYTLTPGSTSWVKQSEDISTKYGTITFTDDMTSVIWSNFEIAPGFEKPGHDPGGEDIEGDDWETLFEGVMVTTFGSLNGAAEQYAMDDFPNSMFKDGDTIRLTVNGISYLYVNVEYYSYIKGSFASWQIGNDWLNKAKGRGEDDGGDYFFFQYWEWNSAGNCSVFRNAFRSRNAGTYSVKVERMR